MILYSVKDRLLVPMLETIVSPEYQFLVPTHYADLAGLAKKYAPKNILELGVKLGWGACALILGTQAGGITQPCYLGIDNEADEPGQNQAASDNVYKLTQVRPAIINADLSKEVFLMGPYDLISVDTLHTTDGVFSLCRKAWPALAPNGIMVVDDLDNEDVEAGAHLFLAWLEDYEQPHQAQFLKSARDWLIFRKSA